MRPGRIGPVLFSIGLVLTLLAACGPAPTQAPTPEAPQPTAVEAVATEAPPPTEAAVPSERERTLVIAYRADIVTLDPCVWYDVEGGDMLQSIYEQLVRYKPDTGEIVPWLAKSWEVSDDYKEYTFHLQEGVTFHDGSPFNAEAMKFSLERYKTVNQGPAWYLDLVESIEVVDETTLKITLSDSQTNFLDLMAGLWGLKAMSPQAIQANEKDGDSAQEWMLDNAVGTGPYKLDSFQRGQQYVLVKNDDYWGGWDHPHVDKIVIQIVPEISTQRLLLEQGDLDLVTHSVPFVELEAMAKIPGLKVMGFPTNQVALLQFNTTRSPLDNPEVRQALAWSFPYEKVLTDIGQGHLLELNGAYPNGFPGSATANPYTQDLEKARQLLAEAGYPDGGFSLEWGQHEGEAAELWKRIGQLWQADLATLGIEMTIQEIPIAILWDLVEEPETFVHVFAQELTPDADDSYAWAALIFYSSGEFNFGAYENPRVDELLDTALVTVDEAERTDLYEQSAAQVLEDAAYVFLAQVKDEMVMRDVVQGIEHVPAYPWCINYYRVYKEGE